MSTGRIDLRRIELSRDLVSNAQARRFVKGALSSCPDDVRFTAEQLTSELVTNALLHSNSEVVVEVLHFPAYVRVEVSDQSPLTPALKEYGTGATTGRGLHLVQSLAARSGVVALSHGKIVWFELSLDPLGHYGAPDPWSGATQGFGRVQRAARQVVEQAVQVKLLQSPLGAMGRSAEYYDSVYRQFRYLLEVDPAQSDKVPGRLLSFMARLAQAAPAIGQEAGPRWERAIREGRDRVDLVFDVPVSALPEIERFDELLDQADAYCRERDLLAQSGADEVIAVRKWAFQEILRQSRGNAPEPWDPSRAS